ncbi:hypothetical protein HYS96_00425 [Candidatus Daviesbacteria bacterium]|nr:hypothetical protein [Candidatus Daviesbacteria bacterium]
MESSAGKGISSASQIPNYRPQRFRNFLEGIRDKFRKRATVAHSEEKITLADQSAEQEYPKQSGIAEFIDEEIARKGLKPPEFESQGASGFTSTNERIDPRTLETVMLSDLPPNGYLIGVGVSNIFSLLDTFPKDSPPKGIVLVNTDPEAVKNARNFVEVVKSGSSVTFDSYGRSVGMIARLYSGEKISKYYECAYGNGERQVDTELVMDKYHDMLVKLAQEGNIAVVQQDFLDPALLEIISRLPGLKDSNNVIYLSNIADWLWRPIGWSMWEERVKYYFQYKKDAPTDYPFVPDMGQIFSAFQNLAVLQPNPGHTNYFADTLCNRWRLNYLMRIQPKIPQFARSDFTLTGN